MNVCITILYPRYIPAKVISFLHCIVYYILLQKTYFAVFGLEESIIFQRL